MKWEVNYRSRKILDSHLLTADHGAWILLSEFDYKGLKTRNPPKSVYNQLEIKGLIRTPTNGDSIKAMLKEWTAPHCGGPGLHIVTISRRCNLKCSYCHAAARSVDSKGEDLLIEMAKRVTQFIFQTPSKSITIEFQGGESLLNFKAVKFIVEYAKQLSCGTDKKISFSLVSNMTLMDAEILRFLKCHEVSICSSLDGPKSLHNIHRRMGKGGSFDLVMKKIQLAEQYGIDVPCLTVLTQQTLPFYREIIDFFDECGADTLCLNPIQPIGNAGKSWDEIGINYATFLQYYKKILDYTFEKIKNHRVISDRLLVLALEKLTSNSDVSYADFRNPCGAIFGQIAYDIDGNIYPCDEARGIQALLLGNVCTHNFNDIVLSATTTNIVNASIPCHALCMSCAYKPFCGLCPVVNYIRTGSLTSQPYDDPRCRISTFLFDYLFTKIIQEPEDVKTMLRYQRIKDALLDANTPVDFITQN